MGSRLERGARTQEEVFEAIKPGFRAFATNPQAAADSLDPLLLVVHNHVPVALRATTPMTLRATAGIRLLPAGPQAAQAIMEAVTAKLQGAGLYVHDDYVSVLSGALNPAYYTCRASPSPCHLYVCASLFCTHCQLLLGAPGSRGHRAVAETVSTCQTERALTSKRG